MSLSLQEPVEQADRGGVFGQEPAPRLERPMAGDAQGTPFVAGGDQSEQQLRAGVTQRCEANLIYQDDVVAVQLQPRSPSCGT